ncbi:MAG: Lrp/AsnC family transcriptional regulator [Sphingomonadales bacterium]|nr:Lrp/AsnC family transcriptional regulator [Sphingomonadales bacterium]
MKKPIKIDRLNRKILTVLHNNADMSNVDLAERVGLSQSACFARRKALKDEGYLVRYVTEMDLDRLCHNVQAYVEVTLSENGPAERRKFEAHVNRLPEFMDCLRVSGDVDYISLVCCSDVEALNRLCDGLSDAGLAIKHIATRVVLDRPKWTTGYPLEKLEWKRG